MQIISQKIGAKRPTMSIIDSKETTPWPFLRINISSGLWWKQIGYDRNPILIVVSDETLVCVGGIGSDNACAFIGGFGWLVSWNDDFMRWLDSKALTCVILYLCLLLGIVIYRLRIFIHIRFTSRPCYYLFLLAVGLSTAFFIGWWSLTNTSIIWL